MKSPLPARAARSVQSSVWFRRIPASWLRSVGSASTQDLSKGSSSSSPLGRSRQAAKLKALRIHGHHGPGQPSPAPSPHDGEGLSSSTRGARCSVGARMRQRLLSQPAGTDPRAIVGGRSLHFAPREHLIPINVRAASLLLCAFRHRLLVERCHKGFFSCLQASPSFRLA